MSITTGPFPQTATSYCRWSSDSYRSDLFCQRTPHGYETHVAVLRRVLADDVREPDVELSNSDPDRFDAEHAAFTRALDAAPRVPIGLAHDGLSFLDDTEEEMLARIVELAALGYRVPDHVLEMARELPMLQSAS